MVVRCGAGESKHNAVLSKAQRETIASLTSMLNLDFFFSGRIDLFVSTGKIG